MSDQKLVHVLTLCGNCGCGCPELYVDPEAEPARQVVVTDDFGSAIRMSAPQWRDIVALAKSGALDAGP
ncbi:hypothetical protein [Pilimelia terevasa]|uniref:hypothetical protein n=1 Tax=Pilimelia terevasa TaxID=53372 RepID=UPI001E3911DD|nr:hypothetical protein [Pilimelia terevasa]